MMVLTHPRVVVVVIIIAAAVVVVVVVIKNLATFQFLPVSGFEPL
jgi:hypothetical protein